MNNLETILSKWKSSRAIRLNHPEKRLVQESHKTLFGSSVNINCPSCVVRALDRLANHYAKHQKVEQKKVEPVMETTAPDLESMNLAQLKELAISKGIPTRRSKAAQIEDLRKSF